MRSIAGRHSVDPRSSGLERRIQMIHRRLIQMQGALKIQGRGRMPVMRADLEADHSPQRHLQSLFSDQVSKERLIMDLKQMTAQDNKLASMNRLAHQLPVSIGDCVSKMERIHPEFRPLVGRDPGTNPRARNLNHQSLRPLQVHRLASQLVPCW